MRGLTTLTVVLGLLLLPALAGAQGSAGGDNYRDPFGSGSPPTSQTQTAHPPSRESRAPQKSKESAGAGPAVLIALAVLLVLAATGLLLRHRRRSRRPSAD
jgi:hypothetical protein